MAKVIELIAVDKGDPSVGINGSWDRITIIYHDRDELDEEIIESIKDFFGEEGFCVDREQWESDMQKEAIGEALFEEREKHER